MIKELILRNVPFMVVISNEFTGLSYSLILIESGTIKIKHVPSRYWHQINANLQHLKIKIYNHNGRLYEFNNFKKKVSRMRTYNFLKSL